MTTALRDNQAVPIDPEIAKKLVRAAQSQSRWLQERDDLIREASASGGSLREIAALVGLSHVGVQKIIGKGSRAV